MGVMCTGVRALLVLLILGAVPGMAGERKPPVFSVGLEVVNVVVTARDDQGALVTDLEAEDFAVFENGRLQDVVVFGRAHDSGNDDVLALDLGMLFDTSESMLEQLKLTKQAAVRFLDSVPRARELFTIFFDQDIRISRYDSENQQGLFERIADAEGGGQTALYDAITVYLSRVQGSSGRKALVMFTDGEDSMSEMTEWEVLDLVRSSPVTIYPVAFLGSFPPGGYRVRSSRAFLTRVAASSGGELFVPTCSKDLTKAYDRILDELGGQYVLGFSSDDPRHDGKFRKLKVELRRKDLKLRHRPGYVVPRDAARRALTSPGGPSVVGRGPRLTTWGGGAGRRGFLDTRGAEPLASCDHSTTSVAYRGTAPKTEAPAEERWTSTGKSKPVWDRPSWRSDRGAEPSTCAATQR
jgi:Ca-activated chloride channel family protein